MAKADRKASDAISEQLTEEKDVSEDVSKEELDIITAAQASTEICGKSIGFFTARAKRGASLPPVVASTGRSVFYKRSDVKEWWEEAQHEKVSRGRRSQLPDGVKSRASVMLLDDEWDAFKGIKPKDMTSVDLIRTIVLSFIEQNAA